MTILALGHRQTDRPTNQHLNLIFSPIWINSSMFSLVLTLLLCTCLSCWRAFVEILFIFWSNFSYFAFVNLDSWSRLDFRPYMICVFFSKLVNYFWICFPIYCYIDFRRMYLIVVYTSIAFKELIFLHVRKLYKQRHVPLFIYIILTPWPQYPIRYY